VKKLDKLSIGFSTNLVEPLIAALKQAYSLKDKKVSQINYDGYEPSYFLATQMTIEESLSEKGLAYHHDQGQETLEVIMNSVFLLGMQHGVNWERDRLQKHLIGWLPYFLCKKCEKCISHITKVIQDDF
jgi:hypothetical protein